jgi:hypothetical protein
MRNKAIHDLELMDASVYSEAKGEYTKQLITFIIPAFHRYFMEILNQATQEEQNAKRQLWKFQELLSQIPEWNIDKVHRETTRIQGYIFCDYLEELLTAVFIAHTKVLTAIRIGNKNKRVQITIPKLDHFLHRALSDCSRLLWSSAYLFHNELSSLEKQKNHRQIEQLLEEGVQQAIRGLLPVKNILKDYLADPEPDTDAEDEKDDEDEKDESTDKQPEQKESVPQIEEIQPATIATHTEISSTLETAIPSEIEAPIEKELIVATVPTSIEEQPAILEPVDTSLPAEHSETIHESLPTEPVQESFESSNTPNTPTIIVETEPNVRFTDFDQVIQKRGGTTHIDYIEQDREHEEDEEVLQILEEEGEPLSEFEDLNATELGNDDYETL